MSDPVIIYPPTAPTSVVIGASNIGPQGPKGDKGDVGATGRTGATGPTGLTGPSPVISVTATTLPATASATATTNNLPNPLFTFGIPKGTAGIVASTTSPTDTTVLWLDQNATASYPTGPTGPQGPQGYQGIQGPTGPTGAGYDRTSTSTNTITYNASKTFTLLPNVGAYQIGTRVRVSSVTNGSLNYYLEGRITNVNQSANTIQFTSDVAVGQSNTITYNNWSVNVAGEVGLATINSPLTYVAATRTLDLGTVSIANGGTGQITATQALSALGGAPLAGATFTGTVVAPTINATNATVSATATSSTDVTNKAYVDGKVVAYTGTNGVSITGTSVSATSVSTSRVTVAGGIDLAAVTQTNSTGNTSSAIVQGVTVDSYGRVTGVTSGTHTLAATNATGIVQLTDATNSTSITTAATPNAVKSAYDRGSLGVTNAATAQSAADGKVSSVSGTGAITVSTGTTPQVSVATATSAILGVASFSATNFSVASGAVSISSVAGSSVSGNITGNAANVTETVVVGKGGTGATTFATNGVLLGNGTSALSATAAPTSTTRVLISDYVGYAPIYGAIDLADNTGMVSGVLGLANGGTGASSAASALTALGGASLTASNAFTIGGHTITNADPAVKPLMIKAASSQSANLFEIQPNGSTTPIMQVTSFGGIIAPYLSAAPNGLASTRIYATPNVSEYGLVIRGSSNQNSDLVQYQSSSTTVLSGVGPVGQFYNSTAPYYWSTFTVTSASYVSGTTGQFSGGTDHRLNVGDYISLTSFTPTTWQGTAVVTSISSRTTFNASGPQIVSGITSATAGTVARLTTNSFVAPNLHTPALVLRPKTNLTATLSSSTLPTVSGTSITYTTTAAHGFQAGDLVSISGVVSASNSTGAAGSQFNQTTATIAYVPSTTSFIIVATITDTSATAVNGSAISGTGLTTAAGNVFEAHNTAGSTVHSFSAGGSYTGAGTISASGGIIASVGTLRLGNFTGNTNASTGHLLLGNTSTTPTAQSTNGALWSNAGALTYLGTSGSAKTIVTPSGLLDISAGTVTGVVGVANGGTSATTAANAVNALDSGVGLSTFTASADVSGLTTAIKNVVCNSTATITLTLQPPTGVAGKEYRILNLGTATVVSASANVIPRTGGSATTAILPATAGAWATLISNGTNYQIMASS